MFSYAFKNSIIIDTYHLVPTIKSLAVNKTLIGIDVSKNFLCAKSIEPLSKVLAKSAIQDLNLGHNNLKILDEKPLLRHFKITMETAS